MKFFVPTVQHSLLIVKMLPAIPTELKGLLLPDKNLSILDFIQLTLPPMACPAPTISINIGDYISDNEPEEIDNRNIEIVSGMVVPPASIVKSLRHLLRKEMSTSKSIQIPFLPTAHRLPLWIIPYWESMIIIWKLQSHWHRAEVSLQKNGQARKGIPSPMVPLINSVYSVLAGLTWGEMLHGFPAKLPVDCLTTYLTMDWLSDEHLTQLLELLKQNMWHAQRNRAINVEAIHFIPLLCNAYNDRDEYQTKKHWEWLQAPSANYSDCKYWQQPLDCTCA